MMHRELIPWVMGFYIVNAITVNCKIVQLSAETTDNFCTYWHFDAIAKSSQDKVKGVVARCMQGNLPALLSTDEVNSFWNSCQHSGGQNML